VNEDAKGDAYADRDASLEEGGQDERGNAEERQEQRKPRVVHNETAQRPHYHFKKKTNVSVNIL